MPALVPTRRFLVVMRVVLGKRAWRVLNLEKVVNYEKAIIHFVVFGYNNCGS